MKAIVIGAGCVGLATAAVLAHKGCDVVLCEKDGAKLHALNSGVLPVAEPGLGDFLFENSERILFCKEPNRRDQAEADAAFLCVGTPGSSSGRLDCSAVLNAALCLDALPSNAPVVVRSTVNPDTPAMLTGALCRAGRKNDVAVWPEFLSQGNALRDTLHPERSVLGCTSAETKRLLLPLLPEGEVFCMTPVEAVLTKLCANACLAARLAFFGEVYDCCATHGARYEAVARAMGADSRIGPKYMDVGAGFGGSCLPKDTAAFCAASGAYVAEAALRSNALRLARPAAILHRYYRTLSGMTVAVLGYAHKIGTDDARCSPAAAFVRAMKEEGALLRVYDPCIQQDGELFFAATPEECLRGACAAVAFLPLPEVCALRPEQWVGLMREPLVLDCFGALDEDGLRRAGVVYEPMGARIFVNAPNNA